MTKAERLRRQRAKQSGELAPIPRRKSRGQKRMAEIKREKAEDTPVLIARARQTGASPDEARDVWFGCPAGRAMASVTKPEDRPALWAAIHHMRTIQAAYDRAIGCPSRHAQSMRIMLPTDEMHADASSPPLDLRTEAEKARQARSALARVNAWLSLADPRHAAICKRVVIDDERCPDAQAMVSALRCVVAGLSGRKI